MPFGACITQASARPAIGPASSKPIAAGMVWRRRYTACEILTPASGRPAARGGASGPYRCRWNKARRHRRWPGCRCRLARAERRVRAHISRAHCEASGVRVVSVMLDGPTERRTDTRVVFQDRLAKLLTDMVESGQFRLRPSRRQRWHSPCATEPEPPATIGASDGSLADPDEPPGGDPHFDGDGTGATFDLHVVHHVALLQVLEAAIGDAVSVEIELAAHAVQNEAGDRRPARSARPVL